MYKRLIFPAVQKNNDSIGNVLSKLVPRNGLILEIASGSGEHAVIFQKRFPGIIWQASDPEISHRNSISAWIDYQGLTKRMPQPIDLNVEKKPWPLTPMMRSTIQGAICINMIHISPWSCTKALFEESIKFLKKNQFLILYGPFFRKGKITSESNISFDQSLKLQNPFWGIRHLDSVNEIAFKNGFVQEKIIEMPANNLSVIYRLN